MGRSACAHDTCHSMCAFDSLASCHLDIEEKASVECLCPCWTASARGPPTPTTHPAHMRVLRKERRLRAFPPQWHNQCGSVAQLLRPRSRQGGERGCRTMSNAFLSAQTLDLVLSSTLTITLALLPTDGSHKGPVLFRTRSGVCSLMRHSQMIYRHMAGVIGQHVLGENCARIEKGGPSRAMVCYRLRKPRSPPTVVPSQSLPISHLRALPCNLGQKVQILITPPPTQPARTQDVLWPPRQSCQINHDA